MTTTSTKAARYKKKENCSCGGEVLLCSDGDGTGTLCKRNGSTCRVSKQLGRKTMRGLKRMNERTVTGQDIKDSGLLCNSRKSVRG